MKLMSASRFFAGMLYMPDPPGLLYSLYPHPCIVAPFPHAFRISSMQRSVVLDLQESTRYSEGTDHHKRTESVLQVDINPVCNKEKQSCVSAAEY